jgi:hypothetical protein
LTLSHTSFKKFTLLSLIIVTMLGCSLFTPSIPTLTSTPHTNVKPTEKSNVRPSSLPIHLPTPRPTLFTQKPTQATATSSGSASTDQIDINYIYTDNLITILFPLYGSVLDDFVIVTLQNNNSTKVRIVVTSEIVGYTDPAINTEDIDAGAQLEVRQNPRLITERIDNLNDAKPASFHIKIVMLDNGDEKILLDETQDTLVYGRRDFPWAIEGFTAHEDFELLASMVTPNDPAVESLIRAAANHISSGIMTSGYGGVTNDDDGSVWARLEAIWDAEADDYNLTYISTMVTFAPGDVQRIRLPADVLNQQSGNCVELAILFASTAEALGLETALIRIPGHAYMAVRMDEENADYYVVETTMIGRYNFSDAVDKGSQEFNDAISHIQNEDQYYDWITIQDARTDGILPLPWN